VMTITGSQSINMSGHYGCIYGIEFVAGNSGGVQLLLNNDVGDKLYEQCKFTLGSGTSSGAQFKFGDSSRGLLTLRNCVFKPTNAGHTIGVGGKTRIIGGSIDGSVAAMTSIFIVNSNGAQTTIDGFDMSAAASSANLVNLGSGGQNLDFNFNDCKLPAGTPTVALTSQNEHSTRVALNRCSNGTNPIVSQVWGRGGSQLTDLAIYRAGGAEADAVPFGWKVATGTITLFGSQNFYLQPLVRYNDVLAADLTFTIYGVWNAAALPTNADIWCETQYLGSGSSLNGTIKSNAPATIITTPSNHTADTTSDWDNGATARANTTAYVLGDVLKVASNSGRIFFCTTAGTTAGSEPGGYASAVDGGSVTDGTAVFRAGYRFSFDVTLTSPQPNLDGFVYATLNFGSPSKTFYVDPMLDF
jgi:hypothetical protein